MTRDPQAERGVLARALDPDPLGALADYVDAGYAGAQFEVPTEDAAAIVAEVRTLRRFVNAARAFIRAEELDSSYGAPAWALLKDALDSYDRATTQRRPAGPDPAAEVDRLRGLLAKLEWAGNGAPQTGAPAVDWASCPVCGLIRQEPAGGFHLDDCWLAAEVRGWSRRDGEAAGEAGGS
ncbi:MAG TPA: hypothetical protein VG276_28915 [Actinomycetes bacterium]|nr:hypothetical protein [Actinomycetes bacterium]